MEVNKLDCLITAGNSGVGTCFFDLRNMVGAILAPKNYEIDVVDLQANLIAAAHHASKANRIYPIYDFTNTTDNTEEKTIQTMNTGAKYPVREGDNDWKFQYVDGGLSLLKELRKFNGTSWDFYFIDAENKFIGIEGSTETKIRAIPSRFFWADPFKLSDGSKITEYLLQFVFEVKYLNDYYAIAAADFDIPSIINGLQNVTLKAESSGVPGTYDVTVLTTATKTNIGDIFGDSLADPDLWVALEFLTGNAITILTVVYDEDTKKYKLGLDVADPDYPGVGEFLLLNLNAPAVLQAAGIDGYESVAAAKIVKN